MRCFPVLAVSGPIRSVSRGILILWMRRIVNFVVHDINSGSGRTESVLIIFFAGGEIFCNFVVGKTDSRRCLSTIQNAGTE